MLIQNSSSPPFYSVSTIIFVLIFIFIFISTSSTSFGQEGEDELFRNCSSLFSCGQNFPNITYPFWGGNKSQDCGLEGFRLTCHQDDHLTIGIAGQTFRVLDKINTSHVLRIARNDLWDNACPENISDASYNASLFRLRQGFEDLPLYYGCPGTEVEVQSRVQLSCRGSRDNSSFNVFYLADWGCESRISVLVLGSAFEEFRRNESRMTLQELLYEGLEVDYDIDAAACLPCEFSGGLCWSGTNSSNSSCLCRDGTHDHVCPVANIQGRGSRLNFRLKITISLGSAGLIILVFCVIYFVYHTQSFMSMILRTKTKEDKILEAFFGQCGPLAPKRYSYSEVKKITNSFKDELGQGGYGTVYKGKLTDGRLVAVKMLNIAKENGEEFINEVLSMSKTSHVNIVMFLGFCFAGKQRALVYDYMSNGSLEKYIHGQENAKSCNQLGMDKLYQISLGVARGLEYLHQRCNTRILHFDIKPHNILLDENFCPKISDFGLAKQCMRKESFVSIVGARGTIGYIAPELVSRSFGGVSYKSDVYSYGMMILEIVGRRKNVSMETSHTSEVYFPYWAYQHLVVKQDLRLRGVVTPEEDEIAKKIISVGLWCIQNDPSQRPTMSKVIEMLEGSLHVIEIPPKAFFGSPSTTTQVSLATTMLEGSFQAVEISPEAFSGSHS